MTKRWTLRRTYEWADNITLTVHTQAEQWEYPPSSAIVSWAPAIDRHPDIAESLLIAAARMQEDPYLTHLSGQTHETCEVPVGALNSEETP